MTTWYGPKRLPVIPVATKQWPVVAQPLQITDYDAAPMPRRNSGVICPHLTIDGAPPDPKAFARIRRVYGASGRDIQTGFCTQMNDGVGGAYVLDVCATTWHNNPKTGDRCPFLPEVPVVPQSLQRIAVVRHEPEKQPRPRTPRIEGMFICIKCKVRKPGDAYRWYPRTDGRPPQQHRRCLECMDNGGLVKLSAATLVAVRADKAAGVTYGELRKKYDLSEHMVRDILRGKRAQRAKGLAA